MRGSITDSIRSIECMGTADIPLLLSRRRVNRRTLDDLNRATWANETFADAFMKAQLMKKTSASFGYISFEFCR